MQLQTKSFHHCVTYHCHRFLTSSVIHSETRPFATTTGTNHIGPSSHHYIAASSQSSRFFLPLHLSSQLHTITSTRPRYYGTMSSATKFYDFTPKDKKGEPFPLSSLKGKVVLVVNTASKCGFTPQFKGLEELYKSIESKHPGAFTILGFPCNQFGSQDPGSNDEIQNFCQVNYGVTFPILGKTNVNGDSAEPLFEWLKSEKPGIMGLKRIVWNFEKWLLSTDGQVVGRWRSITKPESLQDAILKEIRKGEKSAPPAPTETTTAEAPKEEAKLS